MSVSPRGRVSIDGGPAAVRGRRRRHRRPLRDPAAAARPGLGVAAGGLAARRAPLASRSRPGREGGDSTAGMSITALLGVSDASLMCQRTPSGLQKSPTMEDEGA